MMTVDVQGFRAACARAGQKASPESKYKSLCSNPVSPQQFSVCRHDPFRTTSSTTPANNRNNTQTYTKAKVLKGLAQLLMGV